MLPFLSPGSLAPIAPAAEKRSEPPPDRRSTSIVSAQIGKDAGNTAPARRSFLVALMCLASALHPSCTRPAIAATELAWLRLVPNPRDFFLANYSLLA